MDFAIYCGKTNVSAFIKEGKLSDGCNAPEDGCRRYSGSKSINLVKFKKLMLLFTRLFVYLQYKNIIIIVTIVVFLNLKGGVGKNTLCCYFAHFLVAKNSVAIQRL